MNQNIENLLNTCLEIEGLLCLVARRGDGYPANVIALLKQKTETISNAIDSLGTGADATDKDTSPEELPSELSVENEEVVELVPETSSPIEIESLKEEFTDDDIATDLGEAPEPACLESIDAVADDSPVAEQHENAETAVADEPYEDNLHPEPGSKPVANQPVMDRPTPVRNDMVAIELTINDKFRFRRELFANNEADLSEALQIAANMSSAEEIEDYFYNDLCFDAESEVVKDFMRIVTSKFQL